MACVLIGRALYLRCCFIFATVSVIGDIMVVVALPTPCAVNSARGHRLVLTSNGLTSSSLQSEFQRMLGNSPERWSLWYIPTATLNDGGTLLTVSRTVARLQSDYSFGRVEVIDPERVNGSALRSRVAGLGQDLVIWAESGNTYALRYHLRQSGGDALVYELMDQGAIYVGSSAGSIVAGRTVQMAFWKNWDDRSAGGTISVNWTDPATAKGLDLAGGRSIFPHANGRYANKTWQDEQARRYGHTDHEVVKLADGEGFVIDGSRCYRI
mmetsp:Transcript_112723/g.283466  ORF Transcript_112723/g.283466 Transcript_112723/m.283466 type:complete len:268 (-) Transcript_112723:37-840(-)